MCDVAQMDDSDVRVATVLLPDERHKMTQEIVQSKNMSKKVTFCGQSLTGKFKVLHFLEEYMD